MFDGFKDIKASHHLISQTKSKMIAAGEKKNKSFSYRKLSFSMIPVILILLAFTMFYSSMPFNKTAQAEGDLMAGVAAKKIDVRGALSDKFINSTQSFSIELFKNTVTSGKNSLISPTSVFFALGMTANGADGETLNAFRTVLAKDGLTLGELNKEYKAYADELTQGRGSTALYIANSIWFRDDFTPKAEFLQNNADYFGAGARKLDFNDKTSADVINNWVRDNTNGKIEKTIEEINPGDIMHLINTIYINAKWEKPFDIGQKASQGKFYLGNGTTQTTMFMHLSSQLDYMSSSSASAVLLPYDDGRLAFLCILPNEGLKLYEYIETMDERTITELMIQKTNTEIAIELPQFKAACNYELNDVLKNMGLGSAFDGYADFSKMGNAKENLVISSVMHKTFLQVDEMGTEAGAVTDVMVCGGLGNPPTLVFNRPFVYAIVDTKTNLPIFIGTMENPQN